VTGDDRRGHQWKYSCQRFVKRCLDRNRRPKAITLRTDGKKFSMMIDDASHFVLLYLKIKIKKKLNKNHLCYFTLASGDETIVTPQWPHCRLQQQETWGILNLNVARTHCRPLSVSICDDHVHPWSVKSRPLDWNQILGVGSDLWRNR